MSLTAAITSVNSAAGMLERLVAPCERVLADANLAAADIEEVLLVGGMSRIPSVQATVERIFVLLVFSLLAIAPSFTTWSVSFAAVTSAALIWKSRFRSSSSSAESTPASWRRLARLGSRSAWVMAICAARRAPSARVSATTSGMIVTSAMRSPSATVAPGST